MAVGVQIDLKGATLEQYDKVNEGIGLLPGGPAVREELFHWVTKTEDGIRIIDVWESREAFEKFAQERLGPVLQEVGLPTAPEVQYFEVHNYFAGGRWGR